MKILETLDIAFSMYSRIPMPHIEWTKENMKYAMCAFPLIGAVIGAALWGFYQLCAVLNLGTPIIAAGMTVLPILITGGIHLDGYCDTCDALASNGDTARKLEILKDSNSGAFAIIGAIAYFVIYYSVCSEIEFTSVVLEFLPLIFMLSRSLSGFAVASFKCARNSGLLHAFSDAAHKKSVCIFLGILIVIICALMTAISWVFGLVSIFSALICFGLYRRMAYSKFGGTTGDLAGYFLQICELAILFALMIAQKLI